MLERVARRVAIVVGALHERHRSGGTGELGEAKTGSDGKGHDTGVFKKGGNSVRTEEESLMNPWRPRF